MISKLKHRTISFVRKYSLKKVRLLMADKREYDKSIKKFLSDSTRRGSRLAVVVHLYYTDVWPVITNKLENNMHDIDFDLYITTPKKNVDFIMKEIIPSFSHVNYLVVPNRGRDVLPFVMLVKQLQKMGYEYFLKLQTKKSTHWDGGGAWLKATHNNLIPSEIENLKGIIEKLELNDTGIIGAKEFYYPLTVNFPANGLHMSKTIRKIYDRQTESQYLQLERSKYGFFAGTMFWGRFDAIEKLINHSGVAEFEAEAGQIDGTYAHALERLFCVVPEIDGKKMYQLDGSVSERPYGTENIPNWSEDHDK